MASAPSSASGLSEAEAGERLRRDGPNALPANRPRSLGAMSSIRRICEEHLAGEYHIEVVDLLKNPQLAKGDQILALPTLVRSLPEPVRKIIGDLSNTDKVLVGLDLRPRTSKAGV